MTELPRMRTEHDSMGEVQVPADALWGAQTARAVERYRVERRSVPESLEELVPRYLAAAPVDPWGRPLVYSATGNSYRLSCLGADGAPGGQGESLDLVVRNGAFVSDAP